MNTWIEMQIMYSRKSVACRILSMDKRLRVGKISHDFEASNGMHVRSWNYPELNDHALYLRGDREQDDDMYFVSYPFKHTVNELVTKMLRALLEYVHSVAGEDITLEVEGNVVRVVPFTGLTQLTTKE